MATLKVMFDDARDTQWFPGVTHVAVGAARWKVDQQQNPLTDEDTEIAAAELRLVESARTGQFGPDQDVAMMVRMEGPGIHWREGVIAPSGCAYLLGDDGKTIDRVC